MLGIKLALILFLSRKAVSELKSDPEIRPGYYQGDIRNRGIQFRNGIDNKVYHWPNATVYYVIQPNVFDKAQLAKIYEAMADIMGKSCVVFKLATEKELPFALYITGKMDGCNAMALGFRTNSNGINLEPYPIGEGCFRMGSIIHEFLHALGFEHQHVAQNRDEYIRIEWENIDKEYFVNFVNEDNTTTWHGFGEPYDYDSVMHYIPLAFSKNGEPTIVPLKEGNHRMGQRYEMSKTDVRKLNKMYKCHGHV